MKMFWERRKFKTKGGNKELIVDQQVERKIKIQPVKTPSVNVKLF
jgi:transposase